MMEKINQLLNDKCMLLRSAILIVMLFVYYQVGRWSAIQEAMYYSMIQTKPMCNSTGCYNCHFEIENNVMKTVCIKNTTIPNPYENIKYNQGVINVS